MPVYQPLPSFAYYEPITQPLPLLFKGRAGEGLRKNKKMMVIYPIFPAPFPISG